MLLVGQQEKYLGFVYAEIVVFFLFFFASSKQGNNNWTEANDNGVLELEGQCKRQWYTFPFKESDAPSIQES